MKYLRLSWWSLDWTLPPVTVITGQDDMTVTVEEFLRDLPPGQLHTYEVFEDEADLPRATVKATARMERRMDTERNMNVLYVWLFQHLRLVNEGGLLATAEPAPMPEPDVRIVLEQIAKLPFYKRQQIAVMDTHGVRLELKDGRVFNQKIADNGA